MCNAPKTILTLFYKKNRIYLRLKKMEKNKNLSIALYNFKQELQKPENIVPILESGITFLSIWNPIVGAIMASILTSINMGLNIYSSEKAERRLKIIIQTIEKIIVKQEKGESNFEAALICPELFRNTLIFEDEERVREHLSFIEMLFSSGSMHFDDIAEALRLVNQLSGIEYKLLKKIPNEQTKWKDILEIKEIHELYITKKEYLISAFLSLINMNLVVRKLVIRHDGGPELGTINFDDDSEYIKLSLYGKLFIETIENIKSVQK
jgi:hypothetical protein